MMKTKSSNQRAKNVDEQERPVESNRLIGEPRGLELVISMSLAH